LISDRSLFQISVDRILPVLPPDRLLVVTVAEQTDLLRKQAPILPRSAFIVEPEPKGTASVVGLAALEIRRRDPEAVMAVLTADHLIQDEALFRKLVTIAYEAALTGELVTLGIRPTNPATGYGYLERGKSLGKIDGIDLFRVDAFREKPDENTAMEYASSGHHYWNSGMFFWRVDRILEELQRHMPDLYRRLEAIDIGWEGPERMKTLQQEWSALVSETIDFGVMEKVDQVAMVEAEGLGWYDLGSWSRLFDVLEPDEDGNLRLAPETIVVDSKDSLIVQDRGAERLIAVLGARDLIIVDTGAALLVASRHRAQDIRQLVEQLRSKGREKYL
jgi:mannose-1-phosphate guanylyltransferase